MIQSNELRLGNKVYTVDRSKEIHLPVPIPFTILTIGIFGVAGIFPHQSAESVRKWAKFKIIDLSPIPLTEEWLLKLGFKKDNTDGYFYSTPKTFPVYRRFQYFGIIGVSLSIKEFMYVHELQNIIYAMSGKELEILAS